MGQLQSVLEKQRQYFLSDKTLDIGFRIDQLKLIKKLILKNEKEISKALFKDLGKSTFESFATETNFVIREIDYFTSHLKKWNRKKKLRSPLFLFPSHGEVTYRPHGCALILAPWNYPFQLLFSPLVGAVGAGNTAILKPSEVSSVTHDLVGKMVNDYFPPEFIYAAQGGVDVATELLEMNFDFIFFTGSTQIGKIVMEKAARNLTPVCLELGGKSPCIVHEDANLSVAARRISFGKFTNSGQTCVAPDYVYVHSSVRQAFLRELTNTLDAFYEGSPSESGDYGKIVSERHFIRLQGFLKDGRILYGGETSESERYISPTVLGDINWNHAVMQEEIFGPILPILEYDNLDALLELIKSKPRPLAFYFFSRSKRLQDKVLKTSHFGGGCINDCIVHLGHDGLPFGGSGESGMGNYHGHHSFELFSQKRGILRNQNRFDFSLRYPPFTQKKSSLVRFLLGL